MAAPSSAIVDTYSQAVSDLTTLAYRDLVDLVGSSRGRGPIAVREALEEYLPALVDQYGVVAADLAAEYYVEARMSAGVTSRLMPAPAQWTIDGNRIESLIRWGVSPEFKQSASTTEMLIGGGLQRLIYGGFRDEVRKNAGSDRTCYGYARKPKPGCCAFCAMLATRVYTSKESARQVVGREYSAAGLRRRANGNYVTRTRGTQPLGERYHDFCRCSTVPVFRTGEYADEWDDVRAVNPSAEEYVSAYAGARNDGTGSTADVLSRMRRDYGFTR